MSFSNFFSEQARKPSGLFGSIVMSAVFNIGNAFLNTMVKEALAIQNRDYVLDIGCGTGKLIKALSYQISDGYVEGVDFSPSMIVIAKNKNKQQIKKGKVEIVEGDFDQLSYESNSFNKVCSVNTIYFWENPENTARKIADILKPGGILVVAFEDNEQLEQRDLNSNVFRFYTTDMAKNLLSGAGFEKEIKVITRTKGKLKYHCVVAEK